MFCCGNCCKMNRRSDYKVSMMESMELEPLGGEKSSEATNSKRNGINKYSKLNLFDFFSFFSVCEKAKTSRSKLKLKFILRKWEKKILDKLNIIFMKR